MKEMFLYIIIPDNESEEDHINLRRGWMVHNKKLQKAESINE